MYDEAMEALKNLANNSSTGMGLDDAEVLQQAQALDPFEYIGKLFKHDFSTKEKFCIIALLLLIVGINLVRASGVGIRLLGLVMLAFSLIVLVYFIMML